MAKPTSALLSAIASEIELPVIPTSPPSLFIPATRINLSSAVALQITLTLCFTLLNYSGSSNSITICFKPSS